MERDFNNKEWEIKDNVFWHRFHINILKLSTFDWENAHIVWVHSPLCLVYKTNVDRKFCLYRFKGREIEVLGDGKTVHKFLGQVARCSVPPSPWVGESAVSFGSVGFPVDTTHFSSWTLKNHFHHYAVEKGVYKHEYMFPDRGDNIHDKQPLSGTSAEMFPLALHNAVGRAVLQVYWKPSSSDHGSCDPSVWWTRCLLIVEYGA